MPINLSPLPYDQGALAPYMSAETLEYHHGKHHKSYVETLNKLIADTPQANKSLQDIILGSQGTVFNNAAQIWNHDFFWKCMKPGGGGQPKDELAKQITRDIGSPEKLIEQFSSAAISQFGSGWAWLVWHQGKLDVTQTADADLPMKHGQIALLTIDVWEHAYYIDHRNLRPRYVDTFLNHLVNWDFVSANFARRDAA
jgi:superoxide dismutase, Fe-Mn family